MNIETRGTPVIELTWYIVAGNGLATPRGDAVPVGSCLLLFPDFKSDVELLPADGRWCKCSEQPALFLALGAIYGYDGEAESFKLPDLREPHNVVN